MSAAPPLSQSLSPWPALPTPRLLLREVQAGDLEDLQAVNADDEVTRFLPYASWQGQADAQAWLARMNTLVQAGSARQLVLQHTASGRVIGTLLLFRYDAVSARLELGYVLGRAHWGQGYAREALAAALSHLFTAWGLRRVEAEVHPDNTPSNRLLVALGFTREGLLRERWMAKGRAYSVNAYGLLAGEWPPRPHSTTA